MLFEYFRIFSKFSVKQRREGCLSSQSGDACGGQDEGRGIPTWLFLPENKPALQIQQRIYLKTRVILILEMAKKPLTCPVKAGGS